MMMTDLGTDQHVEVDIELWLMVNGDVVHNVRNTGHLLGD
jgi:hypothetical protein